MDMRHWHYFLMLENDVASSAAFVEPAPANYATYSDRFAGLLLLIGSEVEVVAKALCGDIRPGSKPFNMEAASEIILMRFPKLPAVEVGMSRYGLNFLPWKSWGGTPTSKAWWWGAYNQVKHNRVAERAQGSQLAVFEALAGLLVLHRYLYRSVDWPTPYPALLECGFPHILSSVRLAWKVPDDEGEGEQSDAAA